MGPPATRWLAVSAGVVGIVFPASMSPKGPCFGVGAASGYPDREFTLGLMEGLLVNVGRFGYMLCPCRLGDGSREEDLDIICPCDYRDPDLLEHDACYCALYVSQAVLEGRRKARRIPERRPPRDQRGQHRGGGAGTAPAWPVWRCRVCGYLCARESPPETCPICHAKRDRFERFSF